MFEEYIERKKLSGWSENTEKYFKYCMGKFMKIVDKPIEDITQKDFLDFTAKLREFKHSRKSKHSKYSQHSIVSRVLFFLRDINQKSSMA